MGCSPWGHKESDMTEEMQQQVKTFQCISIILLCCIKPCSYQHDGGRGCLVTKLGPTLANPLTAARQAPLSVGFPRQEYWTELPFLSPGHLPDPGTEPMSPALQVDSLLLSHQGSPLINIIWFI